MPSLDADIFFLCGILFVISAVLTFLVKSFFEKKEFIDHPNERSSHEAPTPHGGGLAIVIALYFGAFYLVSVGAMTWMAAIIILGTSLPIVAIGFLDDLYDLSAKLRLLVQLICALAVACLLLYTQIDKVAFLIPQSFIYPSLVCVALFLVWMLNLYNFMDGIDGIAGLQAVSVSLGVILVSHIALLHNPLILFFYCMLAAALGFLVWNFPKAKIFMGDVGSGFLGFVFGVTFLILVLQESRWFVVWLILFALFLVDTSVTLVRRFIRGEKIYQAHCSHAYQHASRQYQSHVKVSCGSFLTNMLYLTPIAIMVGLDYLPDILGVLFAYLPMLALALYFKAGASEQQ